MKSSKSLLSIFVLMSLSLNSYALDYKTATSKIQQIERDLKTCSVAPESAADCYLDTIDLYEKLISNIRTDYRSKVDSKLWYSINLGFKKQIDNCGDNRLLSSRDSFFYPYLDCKTNNLHSLAVTTLELHLK